MERMLPAFDAVQGSARLPFGARSAAAVYLGQLLAEAAPELQIMAIARRPGVLSKVAVRPTQRLPLTLGADLVARLREALDGERVEIVAWQRDPRRFIAAALGLAEEPPMVLRPMIQHADVMLGEIDLRGMDGWRSLNRLLASALTGWRIRLHAVAESPAWRALAAAHAARRPVRATVLGPSARGVRMEVHGLFGVLPHAESLAVGDEVDVLVSRLNSDEGRIFLSRRLPPSDQLALPG
jgi:transcription antitermination factor NusA-like protein